MTTERWNRIEELFHSARERSPEERKAFLSRECKDDRALLRELESLLAQPDNVLLQAIGGEKLHRGACPRRDSRLLSADGGGKQESTKQNAFHKLRTLSRLVLRV